MAPLHRALLEILKFLPVSSLLQSTSLVCHQWLDCSNHQEVWSDLCSRILLTPGLKPSSMHPKQYYMIVASRDNYTIVHGGTAWELYFAPFRKTIKSISISRKDDFASACGVMVSTHEFLLIEAANAFKRTDRCDFVTGKTTRLANALLSHQQPSAVVVQRCVYLFGGMTARNAERLNLESNKWTRLPDMLDCRYGFSASFHRKCIYLCGGNTKNCEKYSIEENAYHPLSPIGNAFDSFSFVYNNELMVISGTAWYVLKHRRFVKVREMDDYICENMGPVAPIVSEGKVFMFGLAWENSCIIDVRRGKAKVFSNTHYDGEMLEVGSKKLRSIAGG